MTPNRGRRWLWTEPEQLRRRYVQFDLNALIHIAEEAAGHGAVCLDLSRLPEGNFNKVFLVTMDDGKQLIVKIPNPNAGPAHFTTASEVATMQFEAILIILNTRAKLDIPIPKVPAYCSRCGESKLGAEYIAMEKAPGIELSLIWDDLKASEKLALVKQVVSITNYLARFQFPCYGSLYRRKDVNFRARSLTRILLLILSLDGHDLMIEEEM
ncbi:hypothetical protein N7492_007442 [Penicillium capsulatum]|uniref:Altered inheritance of mitochondria protein 9, mitochondrial n=1 Tax=Penicillium capsulatum TaxID=69766 RepID=A0A9W9LLA8_9EURO|nr:hypothetical protein N7492_007442 [Penicillium capsulatum]KAJ6117277.1 hypothetical protein N7512_007002 [Penicillium capsulatum]